MSTAEWKLIESPAATPHRERTPRTPSAQRIPAETTQPQTVLDEDTYAEAVSYIIERDFFPNLTKIKAKVNYLDALDTNDPDLIRATTHDLRRATTPRRWTSERHLTPNVSSSSTPRAGDATPTFDHRAGAGTPTPRAVFVQPSVDSEFPPPAHADLNLSLDNFQAKYTSEDNASFAKILEKVNREKREKYHWVYSKEDKQMKLLENADDDIRNDGPRAVDTGAHAKDERKLLAWKYNAKNSLMYVPEGLPQPERDNVRGAPKKIMHSNTQLAEESEAILTKSSTFSDTASHYTGTTATPKEMGFSYVPATPTHEPDQINNDELLTWGEIEGAPIFLPGESTPGRSFKFPPPSRRDAVGRKLSERASKSVSLNRKQRASQSRTPVPVKRIGTPLRHADMLSPAAQKLLHRSTPRTPTMWRNEDSQLRNSYRGDTGRVASSKTTTPKVSRTSADLFTQKNDLTSGGSITDNLLKLPH